MVYDLTRVIQKVSETTLETMKAGGVVMGRVRVRNTRLIVRIQIHLISTFLEWQKNPKKCFARGIKKVLRPRDDCKSRKVM